MKRELSPSRTNLHLRSQSAPAWIAILGLIFVLTLPLLVGAGSLLNPIFLLGSFGVGLFLYLRYPVLYVGFTWWLLFLTFFVRRLIDYQSGFVNPGAWHLPSLFVTSISFLTVLKYLPTLFQPTGIPFALCLSSMVYGLLISLVQNSITLKIITIFLGWFAPICFGFHLSVRWRDYPAFRQNMQRVFFWGVLVMGVYGILQYLVAPRWDGFYIEQLEVLSFGVPEPLGIRVFSTASSPQGFAALMMAGLLLLFTNQNYLRFPIAGVGYLAFLLSLARTAWLSWFVGLLIFFGSAKKRLQFGLILTAFVLTLFILPLVTIEPFSGVISARFESLSSTETDFSYTERLRGFNQLINVALVQVIGKGLLSEGEEIGSFVLGDNGFLAMLLKLGWLGTLPYLAGLLLLFLILFRVRQGRSDPFFGTARAIALGTFSPILLKTVTDGESAMILWGFLGIGMAARQYYSHQMQSTEPNESERER